VKNIARRFSAAREGDALELDQAKLRFAVAPVFFACFLVFYLWHGALGESEIAVLELGALVLLFSTAHLAWILWRPGTSHLRRCVAVVHDIGAITAFLCLGGEYAAIVFYLWVIIGNGFRYGRRYLHFAQLLALASFVAVLCWSQFSGQHPTLAAALILALIAIPCYGSSLISRLHAASQRLEEARRAADAANIAKTKFLAAASHDLRQPMQALSMFASVLEQRVEGAEALRVVHSIQLSVRTLEQLFGSLLDISKIESGVIQPKVAEFALMPLIDQVIESERPIAAQKGLHIRGVRCSASVRSDPVLLERMLKNLVTNAIRYTERGRILVGARRTGGGRVRLEVLDSGIGIETHEQQRIFDEYYQVDRATAQGLGLGLPIVKSLGGLLGHPVGVRSAPGRGSVFSIELPLAPAAAAAPAAAYSPSAELRGANIVLVDDDVEIRESVRLLLESWGCRTFGGATLGEVEQKLHAQGAKPDALIVDYRLAGAMTGVQVVEELRRRLGAELPALVITGSPNLGVLRERAAGIPFVLKPISAGKLRGFLSQVLRERLALAS
jgi:signal transduction histidine kinase/CheY-like chemotaxis protein